ncbi:proteinase-activated receptor 3-like [Triplophysa dalaica]|uniref:proteinase-activated receptor 3-like n=1 Tax=Triplophysa dalaica TaxID=1582913 RepID=UPI0024E002D4|nr:proteinase-activated receptor 3-like [Triplophysa dalaica]
MNNSTLILSINETSMNATTPFIGLVNIIEICVLSINILFAFPTNSYVIWLIIKGSESFASEFINVNLSVCEILICLYCFFKILAFWFLSLLPVAIYFHGLLNAGRPLFQCLMCVERYLAVVHPVTFLKYKPLRYKVICCTVAWIICLGSCFGSMCILFLSTVNVFVWFLSVQFLVFLSIQMFCCLAVLRALKQSGPGERARDREQENHMKRKAFYLILLTTVSMLIGYFPASFLGFIYLFEDRALKQSGP